MDCHGAYKVHIILHTLIFFKLIRNNSRLLSLILAGRLIPVIWTLHSPCNYIDRLICRQTGKTDILFFQFSTKEKTQSVVATFFLRPPHATMKTYLSPSVLALVSSVTLSQQTLFLDGLPAPVATALPY